VVGALADQIGRKPVYMLGATFTMAWPFVAFPMFGSASHIVILAAICIGLIAHGLMYAAQPAIMAEMFPTRMRYSGVSLGYQVTAIVAGSWAPLIGTTLLRKYGDWTPIAVYILIAGGISLISAIVVKESKGISLVAIDLEDQRRLGSILAE
jgi:MFS family permease